MLYRGNALLSAEVSRSFRLGRTASLYHGRHRLLHSRLVDGVMLKPSVLVRFVIAS